MLALCFHHTTTANNCHSLKKKNLLSHEIFLLTYKVQKFSKNQLSPVHLPNKVLPPF